MLRKLRWQLSVLYILAAVLLISLIGGGAYGLLSFYLRSSTDLALQYKVAQEYSRAGLPIPPDLQEVEQTWQSSRILPTPTPALAATIYLPESEENHPDDETEQAIISTPERQTDSSIEDDESEFGSDDDEYEHSGDEEYAPSPTPQTAAAPAVSHAPTIPSPDQKEMTPAAPEEDESRYHSEESEEYFDSELASIFILALDQEGQEISSTNTYPLAFQPDPEVVQAALESGSDFRTVHLSDGSRVRLFTYRVVNSEGLAVLQVGRSLQDQDRVLNQLLMGMIILGSLSVILVGFGSWWLAGRSLNPAQRAWDRQQTFIANASHELRAPLTLLRASAEVVQRRVDPKDPQSDLLGDILSETDHMSRLVDDLLLLSRMDAGKLKLEAQPVILSDLLTALTREIGRLALEGGVDLEVVQARGKALADPTRLRQILLIVLDNALRHTPRGGTIRVEAEDLGEQVQIWVRDSGRGIPGEHLPYIFERFYRGDGDRGQESHGSGLGLAIAQGLANTMGGQISLTSQPGQGTEVAIRLPAATA